MNDISRESRLSAAFVSLADTLTDEYDMVDLLHTLLDECVEVLRVSAGGLMIADSLGHLELLASTSEKADLVEVMQLAAGSGPCIECFTAGASVAIPDINDTTEWTRRLPHCATTLATTTSACVMSPSES